MDHIPLVHHSHRGHLDVPFWCDGAYAYDCFGWTGFPERKGFDEEHIRRGEFGDKSSREAIAFLQAWLFVGVIKEVFEPCGIHVDVEDFVREDENGARLVTTSRLPKYIWYWLASETASAQLCNWPQKPRIESFLRRVNAIINDLVRLDRDARLFPDVTSVLQPRGPTSELSDRPWCKILFSLVILGEHIDSAFHDLRDAMCNEVRSSAGMNWELSRLGYDLLTEAGWCLGEIFSFRQRTSNVACLYYISFFDRKPLQRDHSRCSQERCIANQIDDDQYEVRHIDGMCDGSCSHIVVEEQDEINGPVTSVLRAGEITTISLLTDVKTGNLKVVVINSRPLTTETRYVAISHVWSDGLGNPRRNSLPTCQLLRLQGLVDGMYDGERTEVISFWIDTLCVPLEPDARMLAIGRMAKTYEGADKVLVLDSSLQRVSSHAPPEELLMRIRCTIWSQRLWTLQEGMLASDLYFQFLDGLVQGEDLILPFYERNSPGRLAVEYFGEDVNPLANPLLAQIVRAVALDEDAPPKFRSFVEGLPDSPNRSDEKLLYSLLPQTCRHIFAVFYCGWGCFQTLRFRFGLQRTAIGSVATALARRMSSKVEDETLCIGPLLGLDITDLVHEHPEHRMKKMLAKIGEFPQAIIFTLTPRLCDDGYRWAPKTFLNLRIEGILSHGQPAKLTDVGLVVTFPGLSLFGSHNFPHQEKELIISAAADSEEGIMQPGMSRVRFTDETDCKGRDVYNERNLALIYNYAPPCAGILISVLSEIDEIIHGTFLANLRVEKSDTMSAETLSIRSGRRHSPYQRWCLR